MTFTHGRSLKFISEFVTRIPSRVLNIRGDRCLRMSFKNLCALKSCVFIHHLCLDIERGSSLQYTDSVLKKKKAHLAIPIELDLRARSMCVCVCAARSMCLRVPRNESTH